MDLVCPPAPLRTNSATNIAAALFEHPNTVLVEAQLKRIKDRAGPQIFGRKTLPHSRGVRRGPKESLPAVGVGSRWAPGSRTRTDRRFKADSPEGTIAGAQREPPQPEGIPWAPYGLPVYGPAPVFFEADPQRVPYEGSCAPRL